MSEKRVNEWQTYNPKTGEVRSGGSATGGGCFCLLNTMLMLAAPAALAALIVKGVRR